jgi:para-nitrobenzyl esterase
VHSAEIEYALGNLPTNKVFAWTPDDYQVSKTMQGYFANFIKTGNPNGAGLPTWPALKPGTAGELLHLDVQTKAVPDQTRDRYLLLEQTVSK